MPGGVRHAIYHTPMSPEIKTIRPANRRRTAFMLYLCRPRHLRRLIIRTSVSGMAKNDAGAGDALYALLTGLAGRRLTNQEIWEAFGLSKAQFYEARRTGKLLQRADRIVAAAHTLGINPVELLVGLVPGIETGDAVEYVEKKRAEAAQFLDRLSASRDVDNISDQIDDGLGGTRHNLIQRGG